MKRDELDKREGLIAIGLLRQLVEAVGELPARTITPPVCEALASARNWIKCRDADRGIDHDDGG